MKSAYRREWLEMSEGKPLYKLRELRMSLGWSQQQLAERAGVDFRTISTYETGKRAKLSTLTKIAAALNVTVSDLLTDEAARIMSPQELLFLTIARAKEVIPQEERKQLDQILELAKSEIERITKK